MSGASLKSTRYDLFPTTVMTFEYCVPALNESLAAHFREHPRYSRADQAEQSDSLNLMNFVNETGEFARLQSMFAEALGQYCHEIGWRGAFDLSMQMFPNVAPAYHYVPSHNHVAHIAAVYYIHTPMFEDRPIVDSSSDMTDYWRPEAGVLILHDPRFNASLNGGWQKYARVYPKAGLMVMFPAFLWHEVTPHHSLSPRLSVAANFTLHSKNVDEYETQIEFIV